MVTLGLSRSIEGAPPPRAESASPSGGEGGGVATFWKVVAIVSVALLGWIGSQLIVVPTHTVQLQRLEAGALARDARIAEIERAQAAEKSGRDELIALLRAEQADRRRRR